MARRARGPAQSPRKCQQHTLWFGLATARRKINKGQFGLLDDLQRILF
jgi:predicted NUDIX family NTP pyrophosphohydrolase